MMIDVKSEEDQSRSELIYPGKISNIWGEQRGFRQWKKEWFSLLLAMGKRLILVARGVSLTSDGESFQKKKLFFRNFNCKTDF